MSAPDPTPTAAPQTVQASQGSASGLVAWREQVEKELPRSGCVFLRNQAITARYASLYLEHPETFKWAGMAAYASHHVRLALWPLRLGAEGSACGYLDEEARRYRVLHADDLEVLRQTNNRIFDDIYWAHRAYGATPEGLERVTTLLAGDPHGQELLDGFRTIERGRLLVEAAKRDGDDEGRRTGEETIWAGNLRLLWQEQAHMVQPQFEQLTSSFAHVFSAASTLHFKGTSPLERARLFCSFGSFMAKRALTRLGRRTDRPRVPRITDLADRWEWIEGCIVPAYRRFEAESDFLRSQLEGFVREAETALGSSPAAASLDPTGARKHAAGEARGDAVL